MCVNYLLQVDVSTIFPPEFLFFMECRRIMWWNRARHVFLPCREGELSDTIAKVNLINVHELGSAKMRSPVEVAKHAYFLAANMVVAAGVHVREDGRVGVVVKASVCTCFLRRPMLFVGDLVRPGLF